MKQFLMNVVKGFAEVMEESQKYRQQEMARLFREKKYEFDKVMNFHMENESIFREGAMILIEHRPYLKETTMQKMDAFILKYSAVVGETNEEEKPVVTGSNQ